MLACTHNVLMADRRRPQGVLLHHRKMKALTATLTMAILLSGCTSENSNYNNAGRRDTVTDEIVDSNVDADAPEMAPMEDRSTESFFTEGREEALGMTSVFKPSASDKEGSLAGKGDGLLSPDADSASGEAAALHSPSGHGGIHLDLAVPDNANHPADAAGTADAAEALGLHSHEHGRIGPAVAGGGGGGGGTLVAPSELVSARTTSEGAKLDTADSARKAMRTAEKENGGKNVRNREQEGGGRRVEDSLRDQATNEVVRKTTVPRADGVSGDTADSGGIVNGDLYGNHDLLDAPLGVNAVLSNDCATRDGSDPASAADDEGVAADAAAASSSEDNEGKQQLCQDGRPALPSFVSEEHSSLDFQASAAAADAAAARADATVLNAPEPSGSGSTTGGSRSDSDGVDGSVGLHPQSSSSTTGFAAPADTGPQQPAGPGGPSCSSVAAASVSGKDSVPPVGVEDPHVGGGGGDGNGGVDDMEMEDANSAWEGLANGRHRSDGGEEEAPAVLSNRRSSSGSSSSSSSSNGSSSVWNKPSAHARHYAYVRQGEGGGMDASGEGATTGNETGNDDDGGGYGDASGGVGGKILARGSPEELAQLVRDMEAELLRKLQAEEDAKSLLDIWVEKAREYVLTQTVPPTDAECDFSWSRLRCEPKCSCGARLRFGDYTPGRACRLLRPWERSPDLCGEDGAGGVWDPSDEPAYRRVVAAVAGALGGLRRAYEARVAPPSDPECRFSLETRRCEPQPLCRLRVRWGDISLSSGCRLAAVSEDKKAAAAEDASAGATR